MSYLDDLVDWKIDPASEMTDLSLDQVITDFWDRGVQGEMDSVSLNLVITAAMELARRTDAPLAQCLDTAMIWCYG